MTKDNSNSVIYRCAHKNILLLNCFKTATVFISIIIFISGVLTIPCFADNNNKKTVVRVGYAPLNGFLYLDKNGNYTGIAYEILQEMSQYTGWEYEYIETSYEDSYNLIENGQIDIFIPYQKTDEREKLYEYSNVPFCSNKATLLTRPDSPLCYDDFKGFDGITIGSVANTRNIDRFRSLIESEGSHITIIDTYKNQLEVEKALDNGEIDAFISASNRSLINCKPICDLDTTYSYVIGKKGDRTYMDSVDYALEKISKNTPYLIQNLDKKYRLINEDSYPSLSVDEKEYIQNKKAVSVIVSEQDYDPDKKTAIGGIGTFLDMVSARTGLEFTVTTRPTLDEVFDAFSNGEADIMFAFNHDYEWANMHNAWLTEPYMDFQNLIVRRPETDNIKSVAVTEGTYLAYYTEKYFDYNIVYCKSYFDEIDLVKNRAVDAALCTTPIGLYYSRNPKFASLEFVSTYDFPASYSIAVSKKSDNLLLGILDKTMSCFSDTKINSILGESLDSRTVTLSDFIYSNPIKSGIIAVVITVLIVSLILLKIYETEIKYKNIQLTAAGSEKSDFLARISHDIRTPMNAIIGMTTLALDEKNSLDETNEYLLKIKLSGEFLLGLVNDILDMSKMERGYLEFHPETYGYDEFVKSINAMIKPLCDQKNIKLIFNETDTSMPLTVDKLRFNQIFFNLLSNAVKFTPESGIVECTEYSKINPDNTMTCDYFIRDTGIGMSKDFIENKLFKPFSQESSQITTEFKGTGLGLVIVKSIVDKMGGTIDVKSELNKGTEFHVQLTLPISTEEKVNIPIESEVDIDDVLKGRHILLVEDHPLNIEISKKLLLKKEMTVTVAINGKEAVDIFCSSENGYFDAILMDIRMPIMNGLESSKTIRSLDRNDALKIPIIAMTANVFDDDIKQSSTAGMNAHLAKPINPAKLYSTLAEEIIKSKL
ncbi:MAG: transporter substrate-binding domain-containing protein [Candidatus Metalachnospira sp.]|nr:transporter substrate-binding domain-containing protein [Candidatus Metalachnospira sp.]